MQLKYQSEIDTFKLTDCPYDASPLIEEIQVYRYSFSPITHEWNFAPSVVIYRLKNYAHVYKDSKEKCLRCGASYYIEKSKAFAAWKGLAEGIKDKLGYTHMAYGKLLIADGLMSKPNKYGHFTFYESDQATLTNQFRIISEL